MRILAPDHRANGRSDVGDPSRWTVPQMANDVEALIGGLGLDRPVVFGWSFGSFVAQSHAARHETASAYVLVGTVAGPEALHAVGDRLAAFEPERLRAQVRRPGSANPRSRHPRSASSYSPTRCRSTSPIRKARSSSG